MSDESKNMVKVQGFLNDLNVPVDKVDNENTLFVVNDESRGFNNLLVDVENNLVVVQQGLGKVANPTKENYEYLLKANETLVHGAFSVNEEGVLSFRDTLAAENLDCNELESTLNACSLALAEHSSQLISMLKS